MLPRDTPIRKRLVNVRLSPDEFESMLQATHESGADSFTAFCRVAILAPPVHPLSEVHLRLTRLEFLAEALTDQVRKSL